MKTIEGVKVYSLLEVSELLDITYPTVRKYVKEGKLRSRRVGRKYLVTGESIRSFLNGEIPLNGLYHLLQNKLYVRKHTITDIKLGR